MIQSSSLTSLSSTASSLTAITPATVPVLPLSSARRKRARHPENWKRNNYVRKELKDKGACQCTRKCFERVGDEERRLIRANFATISRQQQDSYLLSYVQCQPKKNRGKATDGDGAGKDHESSDASSDSESDDEKIDMAGSNTLQSQSLSTLRMRRQPKLFNSKYFLPVFDIHSHAITNNEPVRVCHFAFLSIHGIGKKRVNNLLSAAFASSDSNIRRGDQRGKHRNRTNRVSEELVQIAQSHILTFPRYSTINRSKHNDNYHSKKSHTSTSNDSGLFRSLTSRMLGLDLYCDSQSLPPRFLSPQLSSVKMYRMFVSLYQPILLDVEKAAPKLTKIDRTKRKADSDAPNGNNNGSDNASVSSRRSEALNQSIHEIFASLHCSICQQPQRANSNARSHSQTQSLTPVAWNSSQSQSQPLILLALCCSTNCVCILQSRFQHVLSPSVSDARLSILNDTPWHQLPNIADSAKLLKPLVSRDKYERLFRSLNLRFGSGKTDCCPRCQRYDNDSKAADHSRGNGSRRIAHERHLLRVFQALKVIEMDRAQCLASYSDAEPSHSLDLVEFSFQSNRPMPQFTSASLTAESLHYKRQLQVYFFGLHSQTQQSAFAYLYDERTGKRKMNEMLSCLFHYVERATSTTTHSNNNGRPSHLILHSDSSVNNFTLICFLNELCRRGSVYHRYQSIQLKLLDDGHASNVLECDRAMAGIDREGRLFPIFKPSDWIQAIVNLNSKRIQSSKFPPIEAEWFAQENIKDWKLILSQCGYVKPVLSQPLSPSCSEGLWFSFGVTDGEYHSDEVWMRTAFDSSEPWTRVPVRMAESDSHTNNQSFYGLSRAYGPSDRLLPVSARKVRDLYEMRAFVPRQFHGYYQPSFTSPTRGEEENDTEVDEEYDGDDGWPRQHEHDDYEHECEAEYTRGVDQSSSSDDRSTNISLVMSQSRPSYSFTPSSRSLVPNIPLAHFAPFPPSSSSPPLSSELHTRAITSLSFPSPLVPASGNGSRTGSGMFVEQVRPTASHYSAVPPVSLRSLAFSSHRHPLLPTPTHPQQSPPSRAHTSVYALDRTGLQRRTHAHDSHSHTQPYFSSSVSTAISTNNSHSHSVPSNEFDSHYPALALTQSHAPSATHCNRTIAVAALIHTMQQQRQQQQQVQHETNAVYSCRQ